MIEFELVECISCGQAHIKLEEKDNVVKSRCTVPFFALAKNPGVQCMRSPSFRRIKGAVSLDEI